MLEGRGDDEAWRHHAKQEKEWQRGNHDYRIPEGESFRDVEKRFIPFLDGIVAAIEETSGNTLIVSHGSILVNMLPRVLSNIDPDFARTHRPGNCDVIIASYEGNELRCVEWCGTQRPTNL
jgi:broad specificity phosphatase PhoE